MTEKHEGKQSILAMRTLQIFSLCIVIVVPVFIAALIVIGLLFLILGRCALAGGLNE